MKNKNSLNVIQKNDSKTLKKLELELNFPVMAINIFDKITNELIFPPCIVKVIDNLRVGVIGIASNNVDATIPSFYSDDLNFTLGREELPSVIKILRTIGHVDLIILISNLGFPQDMKLISEVQGVDLCLCGNTQNRITEPEYIGNTLIIQSGYHGSFSGRMNLDLVDGKIIGYEHKLKDPESNIIPYLKMADIIEREYVPLQSKLNTPVVETAAVLSR